MIAVLVCVFLTVNFSKRERGGNLGAAATDAAVTAPRPAPLVVLMDTTAPDGIYDQDNKRIGASNAKELSIALAEEGVAVRSRPEPLYAGWVGEAGIIALNPDLVIVHRSSFQHPRNAAATVRE